MSKRQTVTQTATSIPFNPTRHCRRDALRLTVQHLGKVVEGNVRGAYGRARAEEAGGRPPRRKVEGDGVEPAGGEIEHLGDDWRAAHRAGNRVAGGGARDEGKVKGDRVGRACHRRQGGAHDGVVVGSRHKLEALVGGGLAAGGLECARVGVDVGGPVVGMGGKVGLVAEEVGGGGAARGRGGGRRGGRGRR